MMRVLGKWTQAELTCPSPSGKTDVWEVYARTGDGYGSLGTIRWFSHWRQYVLAPAENTVWNPDCLDEVSAFVRLLTSEHRAVRRLLAR